VYLQESESDWLANTNKGITGANKIPCKNSVTNIIIVKATSVIINSGMICERICVCIHSTKVGGELIKGFICLSKNTR
jgi:hypothetical protein